MPAVQLPKRIRLPHEVYEDPEAVFHVVFSAAVNERPFAARPLTEAMWQLVMNEHERDSVRVFAATLMPDHLHVVVSPRGRSVIRWVNSFKSHSTRVAQGFRPQRILWQPSFWDRRLKDEAEFWAALHYVTNNPVEAELVGDASEWPWTGVWTDAG